MRRRRPKGKRGPRSSCDRLQAVVDSEGESRRRHGQPVMWYQEEVPAERRTVARQDNVAGFGGHVVALRSAKDS